MFRLFSYLFVVMGLSGLPALVCAAPDVRVVPGSGASYLYFPAEGDSRSILKVVKETGMGLDDNYEVHITFESDPQELLCANTDLNCEKTLGTGMVKVEIKGDWVPGNSSMILPKQGKFSGACSTIDTACSFAMQAGQIHTVRIKTGCNGHDFSVVKLGGGDEALCIGMSTDGQNLRLLAAHKKTISGKSAKKKKMQWGNNSMNDGKDNTDIILNKWSGTTNESAAHYCHDLQLGTGATKLVEWYLPAINELEMVLNGWKNDNFIIPKGTNNKYFSSTDAGKKYVRVIEWSSSTPLKRSNLKYKYGADTLCIRGVNP